MITDRMLREAAAACRYARDRNPYTTDSEKLDLLLSAVALILEGQCVSKIASSRDPRDLPFTGAD